jgi:hypothetical protein
VQSVSSESNDFFISYAPEDIGWAEWIAWTLEEAGYTTTLSGRDFRPGSNLPLELKRALEKCHRVIAVLSSNYFANKYAQAAWADAFSRDPNGKKGILVPIKVEEVSLPALYSSMVNVELLNCREPHSSAALLTGIYNSQFPPSNARGLPAPRKPLYPLAESRRAWRRTGLWLVVLGVTLLGTGIVAVKFYYRDTAKLGRSFDERNVASRPVETGESGSDKNPATPDFRSQSKSTQGKTACAPSDPQCVASSRSEKILMIESFIRISREVILEIPAATGLVDLSGGEPDCRTRNVACANISLLELPPRIKISRIDAMAREVTSQEWTACPQQRGRFVDCTGAIDHLRFSKDGPLVNRRVAATEVSWTVATWAQHPHFVRLVVEYTTPDPDER